MTRPFIKGLLGTILILFFAAAIRAEQESGSQTYVVIVGISNYADKNIQPRPHAEDDAKALYDVFTNKEYRGVDADHARLLLGNEDAQRKSQSATKESILKSLDWLQQNAKLDDL